jgi:hypothetical protein
LLLGLFLIHGSTAMEQYLPNVLKSFLSFL